MDAPDPPSGRHSRQLRSAVRGVVTTHPSSSGPPSEPDVLSLVDQPFTGVTETHERLSELLETFEAHDDRRAVFLSIYSRMTREVARGVRDSTFTDPEWVGEYLMAFANLYREAVKLYEQGDTEALPDPWQLAFDTARTETGLVLQDAALGINAHINYDLALALNRVGIEDDRSRKYDDHAAIIEIIAGLVDEAQESLAARDAEGLETADSLLGSFDEWLTVQSIHQCRESAWRTAVGLNSRLRPRRAFARWFNAVTATGAAYLIVSTRANGTLHETLAQLEGTSEV